jgi:glycosyltransferase involved in cell wall biosynthesis
MKKIIYILSQFPETYETFIVREIVELQKQGREVEILSLKPCRDAIIHPDAQALMARTRYVEPLWSWPQLLSLAVSGITHPLAVLGMALLFIRKLYQQPTALAKAFYVLLLGMAEARRMREWPLHIHAHWANAPTTAALVLARLLKTSYSFTAHAWDIFLADNLLKVKLDQALFMVTCTGYNRHYLLAHHHTPDLESKLFVNYHGVDLEQLRYVPKIAAKTPMAQLLAVGRLVEQKGFVDLVEACALLTARGVAVTCTIVGTGPLKKEFENQIRQHQLHDVVTLAGARPFNEILALYRAVDVLVMPSVVAANGDRDGIPNVLIEAMALGVPVVATTVSGIPELVEHNKTGWLVGPHQPDALAAAIEAAIRFPEIAAITKQARLTVENKFDVARNVAELADIFRRETGNFTTEAQR